MGISSIEPETEAVQAAQCPSAFDASESEKEMRPVKDHFKAGLVFGILCNIRVMSRTLCVLIYALHFWG